MKIFEFSLSAREKFFMFSIHFGIAKEPIEIKRYDFSVEETNGLLMGVANLI